MFTLGLQQLSDSILSTFVVHLATVCFFHIGASIVVVALHAVFMAVETTDPAEQFAVEMEAVVVN